MITYVYGDIFYSPARTLVSPVNTVGAIGSQAGVAYDFRRFFPEMYEAYAALCERDEFGIGQLMLYRTAHKWIINFPTKRHFRAHASEEYIEQGLKTFASIAADQNITSVSFPALGTGDDGLAWDEVRPIMEAYLHPLPISVFVHMVDDNSPYAQERRSTRAMRRWLNEQPEIITFDAFWRDLVKVVRSQSEWRTLDEHISFEVIALEASGRQRANMRITPMRGETIYLAEGQLRDLWQYIRRVGYVMPYNLPSALDEHANYLVALLSQLSILHPIQLAPVKGNAVVGLHLIQPVNTDNTQTVIALGRD